MRERGDLAGVIIEAGIRRLHLHWLPILSYTSGLINWRDRFFKQFAASRYARLQGDISAVAIFQVFIKKRLGFSDMCLLPYGDWANNNWESKE